MDVNEVCRGLILRDAEQQKVKLDGVATISMAYFGGKITKVTFEVRGPLIPGALPKPGVDRPGQNFG